MAVCANGGARIFLGLAAAGLLAAGLSGCGKKETPQPGPDPAPAAAAPHSTPAAAAAPGGARLSQPFSDATIADPPDPDVILPDQTLTGKSVGKLYEEVVKTWPNVPLVSPSGKIWSYTATLDTELGPIDIALRTELAPNHVRNFVALAKVGYYDGLVFERVHHQKSDADPNSILEMVEGGCPMGVGTLGWGSIGYWLKPEFNDKVTHEEGSVGACLGETPDSGACRFYICLSKAPALDGERTIFGKVARGLDVVRRISTQPMLNSAEFPDGTHPEHPILIRKVTIQAKEVNPGSEAGEKK